jgi:hypothetical protein
MHSLCLKQQVVERQGKQDLDFVAGPIVAQIALLRGGVLPPTGIGCVHS